MIPFYNMYLFLGDPYQWAGEWCGGDFPGKILEEMCCSVWMLVATCNLPFMLVLHCMYVARVRRTRSKGIYGRDVG